MLKKCQKTLVLPLKNTRLATTLPLPSPLHPSPCIHSKRRPVCRYHAHMLKTHVRVVPAYTGVFSVSHTTHHTHPTHHKPTTTTTPHGDRHRERQKQGDEREEDREDKTTEERTVKIHFQCGGAWPFFVGVVICLVKPVKRPIP